MTDREDLLDYTDKENSHMVSTVIKETRDLLKKSIDELEKISQRSLESGVSNLANIYINNVRNTADWIIDIYSSNGDKFMKSYLRMGKQYINVYSELANSFSKKVIDFATRTYEPPIEQAWEIIK